MDTLGDIFLTTLWIFLLMAWLVVLFQIVGDVFRDHTMSGWVKALWIIVLIFVPFLSALVYLIARGPGMAERNSQTAEQMKIAQNEYIRSVAAGAGTSPADQIAQAQKLRESGAITAEEFERLKTKALAG